jgi:N-acetyl-anhydromuramyl-L-alanine amidase AmpD
MLKIDKITVHCSATKPSMSTTVDDIRRWHTDPRPKGNGWSDIGYHFVIERNGEIKKARPINEVGAHVKGHNTGNIGICLVGGMSEDGKPEFNYSLDQMASLEFLIRRQRDKYGYDIEVLGHNDLDPNKTCPNFNVKAWWGE